MIMSELGVLRPEIRHQIRRFAPELGQHHVLPWQATLPNQDFCQCGVFLYALLIFWAQRYTVRFWLLGVVL
jgi:hypothetical protein